MFSIAIEVSDCSSSLTSTAGWIANAKLARKACAVRRIAPRFIGFEMPSTPIPK